jgi:hypothetical protein
LIRGEKRPAPLGRGEERSWGARELGSGGEEGAPLRKGGGEAGLDEGGEVALAGID